MSNRLEKHYLFTEEFPYLRTNVTDAIKLLKESFDKYDIILLTGSRGSGKGALLDKFFTLDEKYSHENKDFITDVNVKYNKTNNMIVWPNIEEFNLISSLKIEDRIDENLDNLELDRLKTISSFKKYNQDGIKQLFQARDESYEYLNTISLRLGDWLRNSAAVMKISYNIDKISEQMVGKGLFNYNGENKFTFTGNFRAFHRAIQSDLPKSKKIKILEQIVGPDFGPEFFNNILKFEKDPLELELNLSITIPDLLKYDDQYWSGVLKLIQFIEKKDLFMETINLDNKNIRGWFINIGKTPTDWFQNNLLQSQIIEISKEIGYKWDDVSGIDDNINKMIKDIGNK